MDNWERWLRELGRKLGSSPEPQRAQPPNPAIQLWHTAWGFAAAMVLVSVMGMLSWQHPAWMILTVSGMALFLIASIESRRRRDPDE